MESHANPFCNRSVSRSSPSSRTSSTTPSKKPLTGASAPPCASTAARTPSVHCPITARTPAMQMAWRLQHSSRGRSTRTSANRLASCGGSRMAARHCRGGSGAHLGLVRRNRKRSNIDAIRLGVSLLVPSCLLCGHISPIFPCTYACPLSYSPCVSLISHFTGGIAIASFLSWTMNVLHIPASQLVSGIQMLSETSIKYIAGSPALVNSTAPKSADKDTCGPQMRRACLNLDSNAIVITT